VSTADLLPEHPNGSIHTGSVADELARGQIDLQVSLVSPERPLYNGRAHWVTLTGVDGQFGVWPRHVAMVAALGSGPLRIGLPGHQVEQFVVRGGFVSIADNVVTILVDAALQQEGVDVAAAEADLAETNAELAHPGSDQEFVQLLDDRAWSQSRIKLAQS
jgi:F-type H+-transporting ATPase subunit epsilon